MLAASKHSLHGGERRIYHSPIMANRLSLNLWYHQIARQLEYERSDFSICQIWISLVQSGLAMVFEHFALSYFFGGCSFGEI